MSECECTCIVGCSHCVEIARLTRELDEARAEVEELRTRTAAQLEIETRARDAARAEAERLRYRLQTVVDEQVSPHETLPAEELITLLERSLAEGRHERERLRGALERAERRLTELADVDTFDAEVPWLENEKPEDRARAGAEDARAALAGEGEAPSCTWTMDEDGVWHTACRSSWLYPDGGSPADHGQVYCHACGQRVEAEPHAGELPEVKGGRDA